MQAISETRWLAWLCASRLGFALISTAYAALIPALRAQWGLSASEAGLIQSAWHVGYVASLIAAGALCGHFGAKRTFLAMGYAACIGVSLFAACARDFATAAALHGLAGACAGGSYVPGLALIGERIPPSRRGQAMGWYIAAASLGYALSIVGANALAAAAGTRTAFLFAAGGTVFGQVAALAILRGTPNVVTPAVERPPVRETLAWLWRNQVARLLILTYGFHAWELLGLWAWLPAYLNALLVLRGVDAAAPVMTAAYLTAFTHLAGTAGSLAGGALSDRWGRARVILALSLASALCALAFGWLAAAPLWVAALVAIALNTAAVADSAIYSAALTEAVPARHLSTAFAVRSTIGFGMGAVSPWFMGAVLDLAGAPDRPPQAQAWGIAWSALALIALAGPWLGYRLVRMRGTAPARRR